MSISFDTNAFDRGTDFLLQIFTVQQAESLIAYQGDENLRTRIEELAEKSNEGDLTEREKAEYEGYVRANKFVVTLQAKARKTARPMRDAMDSATRRLVREQPLAIATSTVFSPRDSRHLLRSRLNM